MMYPEKGQTQSKFTLRAEESGGHVMISLDGKDKRCHSHGSPNHDGFLIRLAVQILIGPADMVAPALYPHRPSYRSPKAHRSLNNIIRPTCTYAVVPCGTMHAVDPI